MVYLKELFESNKSIKALAICGMLVVIVDLVMYNLLAALRPGYDQLSKMISELGAAETSNANIASLSFIISGILMIFFAIGLYHGTKKEKNSWIGPLLLVIFGCFDSIGSGLFLCDPGCAGHTFSGQMHYIVSIIGMIAMVLVPFVLSKHFKKDEQWKEYDKFSFVMGILTLLFSGMFVGTFLIEYLIGFFQRLLYYAFLSWILIIAIKLFKTQN